MLSVRPSWTSFDGKRVPNTNGRVEGPTCHSYSPLAGTTVVDSTKSGTFCAGCSPAQALVTSLGSAIAHSSPADPVDVSNVRLMRSTEPAGAAVLMIVWS